MVDGLVSPAYDLSGYLGGKAVGKAAAAEEAHRALKVVLSREPAAGRKAKGA